MNIGEKIKSYRLYKNMTQAEVAFLSEINEKYYGRIERNESIPTISVLEKICSAFNIQIIDLLLLDVSATKRHICLDDKIIKTITNGLKKDIDIHFNRDALLEECSSCIWYHGYIGSMSFDEFQMDLYAEGNIRGSLYINYENVLILNSNDISNNLLKYIKNDHELENIVEFMPFEESVLKEKDGNVLFLTESNWLCVNLINQRTKEIIERELILDSDNIISVLNDDNLLFNLIFNDTDTN